ncbi:hypothetical protein EW923_22740 [Salmonella enterica subsp. enterica serovar Kentucky]|nr:hypothetical protein [Salmonella enterica subsp. enterica serovar Mikawasima]ECE9549886.1 hypothetical protein [Salmonella enterica subsp. enterica serovar Mikawasima]ECF0019033.1 hypothetical protein [Salmonella enterica subsp. enterica serovar Kentucky]
MTAFKENALNAGELASCDRLSLSRLIPSNILDYFFSLQKSYQQDIKQCVTTALIHRKSVPHIW